MLCYICLYFIYLLWALFVLTWLITMLKWTCGVYMNKIILITVYIQDLEDVDDSDVEDGGDDDGHDEL